jgi:hypothetical protein
MKGTKAKHWHFIVQHLNAKVFKRYFSFMGLKHWQIMHVCRLYGLEQGLSKRYFSSL